MEVIDINKKTENTINEASNFKKVDIKDRLADTKVLPLVIAASALMAISLITFTKYQFDSKARLKTLEQTYKLGQTLDNTQTKLLQFSKFNDKSFAQIEKSNKEVNSIITNLSTGADGETQSLDKWDGFELKGIVSEWNTIEKLFSNITKNQKSIIAATNKINEITTKLPEISTANTNLFSSTINSKYDNVTKLGFEVNSKVSSVMGSIMSLSTNKQLSDNELQSLSKNIADIKIALGKLKESQDNDAVNASKTFEESLFNVTNLSQNEIEAITTYNNSLTEANKIIESINKSLVAHEKLVTKIGSNDTGTGLVDDVSWLRFSQALLALGLFIGSVIAVIFSRRQKQTQVLAKELERNQVNENALVDLLESIKPLDDGDFTQEIKVSDKFLSQIADRIDNTRQQFKEIATLIKSNSDGILKSAESTEMSSNDLLNISDVQVKKLEHTIESVNNITNSIDEIAQIAWIAQDEANRSADKSAIGDELVTQSVYKMNEIRDTIQDSAKKIKKLGESAQSITEVTSLIKDITKQINILALNAAIQAASSGESGREFTIVAQEVQRLADDSEDATKKIEELISEIQTDTAIAIASMEKTTQEVVLGAKLTEEAGKSLQEINTLSKTTSEQIRGVSEQLEVRSQEMAEITFEMKELQKVSDESKEAVSDTSIQVEALRDISDELKVTIERFKI